MPVEIKIVGETAMQTLLELSELSTYLAPPQVSGGIDRASNPLWQVSSAREETVAELKDRFQSSTKIAEQEVAAATDRADPRMMAGSSEDNRIEEPKRERGKPSPGKARRTKEEIAEDEAADKAEDEAADKADAENIVDESGESSGMSISSGEERINPEEEAQDAADEAAETERNGGLVPRERLRKALGSLGIKAGVEAVKPGGLIGMTIDQVPEDQIEAMIAKIEAAKSGAPFANAASEESDKTSRSDTATGETSGSATNVSRSEPATRDDLMQAMLDYAEVFDGTRNPADAKLAQVDAGKVFELIFGEGVTKLSAVPADGYDKAIAGIREAIDKNPFKRQRIG